MHIGGTDFDKYLSLAGVMPWFGLGSRMKNNTEMPSSYYFNLATWHTINQAYTRHAENQLRDIYRDAVERDKLDRLLDLIEQRAGHWLAYQVEQGKIALSDAGNAQLHLDRLRQPLDVTLERALFDQAITPLVGKIESAVLGLLRDAGVAREMRSIRCSLPAARAACRCCARKLRNCCRRRGGWKETCSAASAPALRSTPRGASARGPDVGQSTLISLTSTCAWQVLLPVWHLAADFVAGFSPAGLMSGVMAAAVSTACLN